MKMSKLYMPTLREVQSEAELPSHQLLLRAGMIRKLASGVYTFLPLGFRVFQKIEAIVRQEMDLAGAQEVLMSALQPQELWEESGRWATFGPEMFRLNDRNTHGFCLGPTHEEIFTHLVKNELRSYKQLPLNMYQIQTKFRDEKRPRYGLLRTREFSMKDAYSFDVNEDKMKEAYFNMWTAYEQIFERCGLLCKVVEGDAGAMGDSDSHEFTAISEHGESNIIYCDHCDYAATDEKAKTNYTVENKNQTEQPIERIHTPQAGTIEELMAFLDAKANQFVKTLLYSAKEEVIAVLIPGDRSLNETKLLKVLKIAEHELIMADARTVERVTGAQVGFAGPVGLRENIRILLDSRIVEMKNFYVGANESDYHLKNINFGRDFTGEIVEDLLLTTVNDPCPKCASSLFMDKGIEVGNIFQLRTKYSESMKATFLDENGKEQFFWMGSYGIGVSRTLAAIIEQHHDEKGILWPVQVAPYTIQIIVINTKDEIQNELALELEKQLTRKGLDVLIDDRNERAGVKFADADLIGIPLRIIVGKRASERILEFYNRTTNIKEELGVDEVINQIQTLVI